MPLRDYHVHTCFSDGADTPERVALRSCERGFATLGFSDHSHTAFDESYCMQRERYDEYRAAVRALAERYAGRMEILCGVEQDGFSEAETDGFDYVIGSLHYFRIGGETYDVDGSPEILRAAAEKHCGGSLLGIAECYYDTLAERMTRMKPNVIGHFDLIAKFNEADALFSERDDRYRKAWRTAADALLKLNVPFEVNTGAMSRGYRTSPYPSAEMITYLAEKGGRFLLSGDAHSAETVGYAFDAICARIPAESLLDRLPGT